MKASQNIVSGSIRPLEWIELRPIDTMFKGPEVVRVWDGKAIEVSWATIIECSDGMFTLLSKPTSGRHETFEKARAQAQEDFNGRIKTSIVSPEQKPVAYLVWQQGRRGIDDVEDYYEIARPGDKSIDGSDPFPVWDHPHPVANAGNIAEAEELVARLRSGLDNVDGGELGGLVTRMNEAADLIENLLAGRI
jgi:hypothetical protein